MPYSKDQISTAIEIIEQNTVNADGAAELFGIKNKFFYRLLQQNKFNLQALKLTSNLFREVRFNAEEIKEIANVYRMQRKSSGGH